MNADKRGSWLTLVSWVDVYNLYRLALVPEVKNEPHNHAEWNADKSEHP